LLGYAPTNRRISRARGAVDDYNSTATGTIARMPTLSSTSAAAASSPPVSVPLPEMVSSPPLSSTLSPAIGTGFGSPSGNGSTNDNGSSSSPMSGGGITNLLPPIHQHYACTDSLFPDLPQREIDAGIFSFHPFIHTQYEDLMYVVC
jgi:hypothetical protein